MSRVPTMIRVPWMLMKFSFFPVVMSGALVSPGSSVLLEWYLPVVAFCLFLSAGFDLDDWQRERQLRKGRWPNIFSHNWRRCRPDFLSVLQGVQTARKNFRSAEEELESFLWEVAGIIPDQIPFHARKTTIEFVATQLMCIINQPEIAPSVVLGLQDGVRAIVGASEAALVPISIAEAEVIRSRLIWIRQERQRLEEEREHASLMVDFDELDRIQEYFDALDNAKAILEKQLARTER